MGEASFWDNQSIAQKVIAEVNSLRGVVDKMNQLQSAQEDAAVTLELAAEENDMELFADANIAAVKQAEAISGFELQLMLSDKYDSHNAIMELHPGAGGTESQDWASILLRMYQRYAEDAGYKVEVLDYLDGDEAGLKSVTLLIKGHNAYGYLKAEKGVHRLVRISPFDASGRRHTSFASVDVIPEFDNEDSEIEVRSEDLRVDTFRSTGAGGQHVNTTDSAVRLTHLPTNIVVSCQSERSQIQNRAVAMNLLKARLFERRRQEQEAEVAKVRGEQKDIAWGSQIRSYVFHPYSMVKDHRTGHDVGNVQAVVDGDLQGFIDAYLRWQLALRQGKATATVSDDLDL